MISNSYFSKSTFLVASLFILFLAVPIASHAQTAATEIAQQPLDDRVLPFNNTSDEEIRLTFDGENRKIILWVSTYTTGKYSGKVMCFDGGQTSTATKLLSVTPVEDGQSTQNSYDAERKTATVYAFGKQFEFEIADPLTGIYSE